MKRTLLILITLFAAALHAQDLGDTLHVAHYDLQLDIRDFTTKIIYGDAELAVVTKQNNLTNITLDLMGALEITSWVLIVKLFGFIIFFFLSSKNRRLISGGGITKQQYCQT